MNIKAGETLVIDEKEVYVTEDMIATGSLSCQTCNSVSFEALLLNGVLYWLCDFGHENKVTLYE